MSYTPISSIEPLVQVHRDTFLSHSTRDLTWRKQQLVQLGLLVQENQDRFVKAVQLDLGRPEFETIVAECAHVTKEVSVALKGLDGWAKPVSVSTESIWKLTKARVYSEPKGSVLIIGAWNYAISLLLGPLVGAMAAGCTAILKPSDVSENVATLIAELVPKYLDPTAYTVVLGAVAETTELLRLRFDHIFYTGSGMVGKIIARAAAEHLCSTTLELGGKSPCIVLDDANMKVAGRRIAWTQFVNAAQTCIAPDYILCSAKTQPKIIAAFQEALKEFTTVPKTNEVTPLLAPATAYGSIINKNHFARLSKLLEASKGRIVTGGKGNAATNKLEITLLADCKPDDSLMQGENFGPVLPILVMDTKDEIINFVNKGDQPLALYIFTTNESNRDYIFDRTRSGSCVMNDALIQFSIPGLPFGGTGPSGDGAYHGKASFTTFSHSRASAVIPNWMEILFSARYPPYSAAKLKMLLSASLVVIHKDMAKPQSSKLALLLKLIAAVGAVYAVYTKLTVG